MVSTFVPNLKRSFALFLMRLISSDLNLEKITLVTVQKADGGGNTEIEDNNQKAIAQVHVNDINRPVMMMAVEVENMHGFKIYLGGKIDGQQIGYGGETGFGVNKWTEDVIH